MNEDITYSIISRGKMVISYKNISVKITGELVFDPPTFYANLISLESAIKDEKIRKLIIDFITNDGPNSIGTKIIFD
jgi:hypothetical protein